MPLQITNSLTRKREPFTPLEPGKVKMYVCGPTVYNLTHVGNARPAVFFDVVRRFLKFSGYEVTYVSNFTDVDDKIINRARELGVASTEVSEKYILEFQKDMDALGVLRPDIAPKVTDTIPEIISLIEGLVKNGSAYVADDGEVFFSVRSFSPYGKLSGKQIDELLVGVRMDPREKKRDPIDFSLWKPQKSADEPAWDSPWGKGRPGWHIECSAMAFRFLGQTFDIHGGGLDLIHPHHENEIAQSEAFSHKPFVRYWLHNNLVSIDNEKMSKSLGNIFLNRDFIQKYGAETLRFLLLSGHYRSPIDFSQKHIRDSQAALHRIYTTIGKCAAASASAPAAGGVPTAEEKLLITDGETFPARWREMMEDDLNTARVVALVFESVRALNGYLDRKGFKPTGSTGKIVSQFCANMKQLAGVMNLFGQPPGVFLANLKSLVLAERGIAVSAIDAAIQARADARARKDFASADGVRADLAAKGIELRDGPGGTEWDIAFSP